MTKLADRSERLRALTDLHLTRCWWRRRQAPARPLSPGRPRDYAVAASGVGTRARSPPSPSPRLRRARSVRGSIAMSTVISLRDVFRSPCERLYPWA